jgi:3-methyladenine DNA glycosylase AlkD
VLNKWLENLEGWAEIDSICQNKFKAKEILGNWGEWHNFLNSWNISSQISKRRASLVLLTGPVGQVNDKRLSTLAFENIDNTKGEKDILITKAISWLLRSLIKNNKEEVSRYLEENKESLPKIATRETKVKLKHGKKTYRL